MKLVIAGGGWIVRDAGPYLSKWGWDVEAICVTPNGVERAKGLADKCGGSKVYTDYSRMLREVEAETVYVAVPNHLHFSFARQALEMGRNVILEKPIASNDREAGALAALAKEKGVFLYEAISTAYQPNFAALKQMLPEIGTVKLVTCNFSQYSSRYDAFRAGKIAPVFDREQSGGALMDLNLYNLHWLMGLFGSPEQVRYLPNLERGVDTSGVLTLQYPGFQAVSIAAKDCGAPCRYVIQGTKGYLMQETPANVCGEVILHRNDGTEQRWDISTEHRLEAEFRAFARQMEAGQLGACYDMLQRSLQVCRVQTQARLDAGIRFPADDEIF